MSRSTHNMDPLCPLGTVFNMSPIGHVESVFKHKNGTPRQSGLCQNATAKIRINKNIFNNPEHSLENVIEYSHVWIMWIFHQNSSEAVKAKVSPPRLKGRKVGLFSSRTPHRPNPIGLTLAKVQNVEGDTLFLTGIDMIDGTPVLDIKPFIPIYDNPRNHASEVPHLDKTDQIFNKGLNEEKQMNEIFNEVVNEEKHPLELHHQPHLQQHHEGKQQHEQQHFKGLDDIHQQHHQNEVTTECLQKPSAYVKTHLIKTNYQVSENDEIKLNDSTKSVEVFTPGWIGAPEDNLNVSFTSRCLNDLDGLDPEELTLLHHKDQLQSAIRDVLASDPRSVYRKDRCSDRLYYTTIDNIHVTAWFDPRYDLMEVLALRSENKQSS